MSDVLARTTTNKKTNGQIEVVLSLAFLLGSLTHSSHLLLSLTVSVSPTAFPLPSLTNNDFRKYRTSIISFFLEVKTAVSFHTTTIKNI